MMTLYDEHQVILKEIQGLRQIIEKENLSGEREELEKYIVFFRNYGDKYHHQKEEDILFSLLKDRYPGLLNITEALEEHHEMFRDYLKDVETAINNEDWSQVKSIFRQYLSDLEDHISAEDDELFVSVDEQLSDAEKERLYFSFLDKDMELGLDEKRAHESSAHQIL